MKPYLVMLIYGHLKKSSSIFIINLLELRTTAMELA